MPEYCIRFAVKDDIDAVFELSRAYQDTSDSESGFLVSNFSLERYRRFLDHSSPSGTVIFLICAHSNTNRPVGFLVGYHCDYINLVGDFDPLSTEKRLLRRFGDTPEFYVIKQVGVARGMVGRGIGNMLYDAFFRLLSVKSVEAHLRDSKGKVVQMQSGTPPVDVFAAVVSHPPNVRSARFHEKMGFLPVLSHGKGPDQEQTQTDVWHTTAQAALLHKLIEPETGAQAEILCAALASARAVYTHEDSLNWTKLTFTTYYFVAIIAAQFILPTVIPSAFEPFRSSLVFLGQVSLALLGVYMIVAFEQKISSGMNFMFAYKRAMVIAEGKLQALSPAFHASVASVPLQSRTTTLIAFMRRIFGGLLGITIVLNVTLYVAALFRGA